MGMHPIIIVISVLLFTVLGFGIGFILNMILKTTWLPVAIAVGIFAYIIGSLVSSGKVPGLADIIILSFGLMGTVLSGWTIQLLRKKGYRMF